MTSRKKVSFGSSGSIVETWIIDDILSNQITPDTDVRQFGSSEFCDDVMPTSRDIVVVTQPLNCNNNNHVVLNDPIGIFRKDFEMSSKQTTESKSEMDSSDKVITTQPTDPDGAVLQVKTKNVNFSATEIISGNVKTITTATTTYNNNNNNDNHSTSNSKTHRVTNSPARDIQKNNQNNNKNNNNNNNSAVISTTQQYHKGKRNSISSTASSGSQSFRHHKGHASIIRKEVDTQEEYFDVLNPQPIGQT